MPIGNVFTYTTGLGTILGGSIGMAVGGPVTALEFAKVGGALGVQTAVASKAGDAVNAAGEKTSDAINSLGRKVDSAIDKTGESAQRLMNTATVALEQIADVWSKIFLCGYALNKSLGSSDYAMEIYNKHCNSMFDNLNCVSISLTGTSLNFTSMFIGLIMAKKIYDVTLGTKK